MALKVHRVVVVGCPRCVLTGDLEKLGVGKSCFCNRFVRPDSLNVHGHTSRISEQLWRDNPTYNGDHFLYWGAATKRHTDGTKTRFQIVEQTEFFDTDGKDIVSHRIDGGHYVTRASATHFISRGKIAYKVHEEEEYAIPSSLKSNPMRARAVQLFPNNEFSEGKGVSGFICLFDPTLEGENIRIQVNFLTKLIVELLKTKRKIVVACTKCDEVNEARIQFGANMVATISSKKPIPFIQTSAKEGINIEEPFNYIVGQYHKKTKIHVGRNSSVRLGLTYSEIMNSRGKDVAFALATFKRLIREKVTTFTSEWNSTWPYLRLDTNCSMAVEVIGVSEAKKIFCQRLMELKVAELKDKSKQKQREKKQEEQTRNDQNEILEAFSTHPDLINESAYDFVYAPSLSSSDTPLTNPSSSPSISSLRPSSSSPTRTTISHSNSLTLPIPTTYGFSPPPPLIPKNLPPVCIDPGEVISYRTPVVSPTTTCLSVNSFASQHLNRSTELLSTLPRVKADIQRHSSLRYKNRTLPPLPTSRPQNFLSTFPNFLTKSHSHLDENEEVDSGQAQPIRRRLSNSIDCLHSNSTINDSGSIIAELEPSPYLSPIDVQLALSKSRTRNPATLGTSSMRIPPSKPYQSLPEGFLTLGRKSVPSIHSRRIGSNPRLSDPVIITKPRSSSSPPPLSILTSNFSSSSKSSLMSPNKVTSLDIGEGWQRVHNILEGDESTEDDASIVSGPFAEVDETDPLPPLMSEIQKSNESLTRISSVRMSSPGFHDDEPDHKTESIYSSIPANEDEEYLTMRMGVSMDDLLSTPNKSGVSTTSLPPAKSVIKKLQMFTNRGESDTSFFNVRGSVSPSNSPKISPKRKKKESSSSLTSYNSTRHSLDSESASSPFLDRNWTRATMFNRRPLPQSPTKFRKSVTVNHHDGHANLSKRKISLNGEDSNIYETIDGEHIAPWLKQLRMGGLGNTATGGNHGDTTNIDSNYSLQYSQIMEHFLATPQVQELWRNSVKTVYSDFVFPDSETTIPPFLINPDYFISSSLPGTDIVTENDSTSSTDETKKLESEETTEVSNNEEEENKPNENENQLQVPKRHRSISKTESITDQVLAQLNQRLLLQQEDSSSSEESDSDDDDHSSDSDNNSDTGEETLKSLKSRSKFSLSSICEQFNYTTDEDDLIMLNETKYLTNTSDMPTDKTRDSIMDSIPHLNGYKESWLTATQHEPDVKVSINNNGEEEDESGTGSSSSPTVIDTPSVSSVVHPAPVKNNNHLAICHFNSLDSGISANGIVVDEQS